MGDGTCCTSTAKVFPFGDLRWPSCRKHVRELEEFLMGHPSRCPPRERSRRRRQGHRSVTGRELQSENLTQEPSASAKPSVSAKVTGEPSFGRLQRSSEQMPEDTLDTGDQCGGLKPDENLDALPSTPMVSPVELGQAVCTESARVHRRFDVVACEEPSARSTSPNEALGEGPPSLLRNKKRPKETCSVDAPSPKRLRKVLRRSHRARLVCTGLDRPLEYQLPASAAGFSLDVSAFEQHSNPAIRAVRVSDDFVVEALQNFQQERDTATNQWQAISGNVPIMQFGWPGHFHSGKYASLVAVMRTAAKAAGLPGEMYFFGSWLFSTKRVGSERRNQAPHVDFRWDLFQHGRKDDDLCWAAFLPLTREGLYLNLWLRRGASPSEIFVPLRYCLFLRSDVVHSGVSYRGRCPRVHFYCSRFKLDKHASDHTEFYAPESTDSSPILLSDVYEYREFAVLVGNQSEGTSPVADSDCREGSPEGEGHKPAFE